MTEVKTIEKESCSSAAECPSTIRPTYISVGCNRSPNTLDWGGAQNQLIYAFSNSVALLNDREPFEIKCTFNRHVDKVNCVKWIKRGDDSCDKLLQPIGLNEFVSGSKDRSLIVWQGKDYNVSQKH
jgi:WD40 repeat protein